MRNERENASENKGGNVWMNQMFAQTRNSIFWLLILLVLSADNSPQSLYYKFLKMISTAVNLARLSFVHAREQIDNSTTTILFQNPPNCITYSSTCTSLLTTVGDIWAIFSINKYLSNVIIRKRCMSWAYFDEEYNERNKTKIDHLELEGKQIEILFQWNLSLFLLLKTSWGIILRGNITKIRIFYVQTSTSRGRRCTLDSVSHGSQDSWSRKPTNKDSNVSNYFLKHVVLNFCKYKKKTFPSLY